MANKVTSKNVGIIRKKVLSIAGKNISKEKYLALIEDQVFNDSDFKRQILETSIKLKLDYDLVDNVIKDFIYTACDLLVKVKKISRRISIIGFFYIDILEVKYNVNSVYNKKNHSKNN
jgi:hypothetical protein